MTTRRHPRTLDEAFPRTASYAESIDGPNRHPAEKWINRALLLAVIVVILSVLFVGPSV